MAAKLIEITAVMLYERFRKDDFAIVIGRLVGGDSAGSGGKGEANQPAGKGAEIGLKGECEEGQLAAQCEYRFYGHYEHNEKYGRQFKFTTFVRAQPHGRSGVVRYLQEAPGIGQARAEQIWNKFGPDSVRVLREHPEAVSAALTNFSVAKAEAAAGKLKQMAALESCTIEMLDLVAGRGFPKKIAAEAIKRWGNRAPEFIKRNPYLLMSFRGAGFLRCDAMYLDLGLPAAKLKRQAICAWHAIAVDSEGHTWFPDWQSVKGIKAKVAGVDADPEKAIRIAARAKMIRVRWAGNNAIDAANSRRWIAEERKAAAEEYVAKHLAASFAEDSHWPAVGADFGRMENGAACTDHQREGLAKALAGAIGVLGGSPGTGKSFTAAALVRSLLAICGTDEIAIAAPTGKAAVRLNEAMQAYKLPIKATTIHRLLVVASADDGWSFAHNEQCPLPHRFVIVDETSMVDCSLMCHLLKARGAGTQMLFIGDVNQLSPVGHGAPLRDMIAAGLPYGELTEIKRNAGTIVRACAAIRDNRPFPLDHVPAPDDEDPKNLKLFPATKEKAADRLIELVRRLKEMPGIDPVWDVQVIVAVNKRSNLSRAALNKTLQLELNPAGVGVVGSPFKVGDKVIATKNGFLDELQNAESIEERGDDGIVRNDKLKVFVANGEFGRVVTVEEKRTVVEFANPRRVVVIPRGKAEASGDGTGKASGNDGAEGADDEPASTGCDLDLGYAVTSHKMQGSEVPVAIVVVDEYTGATGQFGVCDRSWLYTAISRAKRMCFLLGRRSVADGMCKRTKIYDRKTFLVELIGERRTAEEKWRPIPANPFSSLDVDAAMAGVANPAETEWPV